METKIEPVEQVPVLPAWSDLTAEAQQRIAKHATNNAASAKRIAEEQSLITTTTMEQITNNKTTFAGLGAALTIVPLIVEALGRNDIIAAVAYLGLGAAVFFGLLSAADAKTLGKVVDDLTPNPQQPPQQ